LNPKAWNGKAIWAHAVTKPVKTLPAVVLGLLLNVLDALAYGTSLGQFLLDCSATIVFDFQPY
jgi:SulP family sulfate permease